MRGTMAKGLFYLLALVVVAWMVSNSYAILQFVFPGDGFTPILGLVLFDIGALIWLYVFVAHAQGVVQRSIAVALSTLSLIGAVVLTLAHLYLGGQTLVEIPPDIGQWAIYVIGGMTLLDAFGVWGFHIADPDVAQAIRERAASDQVLSLAQDMADRQLTASAADIAGQIAQSRYEDAQRRLLNMIRTSGGGPVIIDAAPRPNGAGVAPPPENGDDEESFRGVVAA